MKAKAKRKALERLSLTVSPALEPGEEVVSGFTALGGPNPYAWIWMAVGVLPALLVYSLLPSYGVIITSRRFFVIRMGKVSSRRDRVALVEAREALTQLEATHSFWAAMSNGGHLRIRVRFADGQHKRFNVSRLWQDELRTLAGTPDARSAGTPTGVASVSTAPEDSTRHTANHQPAEARDPVL